MITEESVFRIFAPMSSVISSAQISSVPIWVIASPLNVIFILLTDYEEKQATFNDLGDIFTII